MTSNTPTPERITGEIKVGDRFSSKPFEYKVTRIFDSIEHDKLIEFEGNRGGRFDLPEARLRQDYRRLSTPAGWTKITDDPTSHPGEDVDSIFATDGEDIDEFRKNDGVNGWSGFLYLVLDRATPIFTHWRPIPQDWFPLPSEEDVR